MWAIASLVAEAASPQRWSTMSPTTVHVDNEPSPRPQQWSAMSPTTVHVDNEPSPRPHILFILQDDLGRYNVAFMANRTDRPSADVTSVSSHLSQIADEGIVLEQHYVHFFCSPTRRSLLTGRTPLHHGELLSDVAGDDIDLRWTTIGQKLEAAGYESHWYGKGHTGYASMNHLPHRIGFSSGHVGFLGGSMGYTELDRWRQEAPYHNGSYSTFVFGDAALAALEAHDVSKSLFMYLPWQSVHGPYTEPPGWDRSEQQCDGFDNACTLYGMLGVADRYVGELRKLLVQKGMWGSTLMIFSSDNGGVEAGVNYPLRGEKMTSWEGGMRVAAFVSGGFVPSQLRGTVSELRIHIADWYPTLCNLVGVDPTDDPPVPPLLADPSEPGKDLYGNESFPPIDGVDVWPMLMSPARYRFDAAHETLWLTKHVLLHGPFKLILVQPADGKKAHNSGWRTPDGVWEEGDPEAFGCEATTDDETFAFFRPCLFDVVHDPAERLNLASSQPELLRSLWKLLNDSQLTEFHAKSPAELLGPCDEVCAAEHWRNLGSDPVVHSWRPDFVEAAGPICGVPGCGDATVY